MNNQLSLRFFYGLLAAALLTVTLARQLRAQDQDDPPARVARLGYMEGSVSFQPAGENEWVEAVPNRPMTTGDKLWADKGSRAEVQLGSATIDLAADTGFSFLNLDDNTVQIQLTAGAINVRVRELDQGNVFEVDTPNQAFTVQEPGRYRVEASENRDYTVVTIRQGAGESTGNGQSYTLQAGQRTTFSGTTSLNAEVEQTGNPDDFDNWSDARYRRYDASPSARYCSRDMVGLNDLDDNGDWHPDPQYGNVWFPRVEAGWAPYHEGHWAWIDPWGWTWVDDDRWGYAPFHYGRWLSIEGRWGWIPGPMAERPIYAPALVVFVGGGGPAFGGNVAWFPLGPREVYVPSYNVSQRYMFRVNISNTTVNVTQVTNVYNTTIVNKSTTITNVTYVNRNVRGAVTAMPQRAFASAQPVAKTAVAVNAQQLASAPVSARATVAPVNQAVLGVHSNTANHVAAPPQAVANRAVIAKAAPPPPPPAFAARQQALAQHPGEPIARQELQKMAPANTTTAALVKRAPPAKPATPAPKAPNQPANRPGNPPENGAPAARPQPAQPGNNRPESNRPEPNQPQPANNRAEPNRPAEPPARTDRPPSAQPNNQPEPNRSQPAEPNNRPETNRPENNRPQPAPPANNRPEPNRPAEPPARTDRPSSAQPNNQPEPNRSQPAEPNNRPETNRPENNRPQPAPPANNRPEPNRPAEPPARTDRPSSARPNNQPEPNRPPETNSRPNERPEPNRPGANPPESNRPVEPQRNQPERREPNPPPKERQQARPPAQTKPQPKPQK